MVRIHPDAMTNTPPPGRMTAVSDPLPVPPQKPMPFDCCESGCERCVYEIYADELAHYQAALTAWRARHPGGDADAS